MLEPSCLTKKKGGGTFLDCIKIKRNGNLAIHVILMPIPHAWPASFTQNIILSAEFGPVQIVKRVNRLHSSSLGCHKDCFTSAALLVPYHIIYPITSSWLKKLQQKTSKNFESGAEITIRAQNWTKYDAQYGLLSNFFHFVFAKHGNCENCTLSFRLWKVAFSRTEAEMQLFHPCKVMNNLPSGNQKWSEEMNCCAYVCQTLIPSCGQTHVVYESIFNSLSTGLCSSNWACIYH